MNTFHVTSKVDAANSLITEEVVCSVGIPHSTFQQAQYLPHKQNLPPRATENNVTYETILSRRMFSPYYAVMRLLRHKMKWCSLPR